MDTVGDDAWKSVRLAWEAELWLPVGAAVATGTFALWIGLTGAAVGFLADATVGAVTVDPWSGTTDVVAGALLFLWIVAPAAVATWAIRDRLTTVRGTIEIGYRVHHPILLLTPPVVVLGVAGLALVGLGTAAVPVLAVLVAGAVWFLVRTVAYSYRVFAFSVPILTHAITLLSAAVLALSGLVVGARAAGRGALVESVAAAVAARTDRPALATLAGGTVDLAGVSIPAVVVALVGVPVGLSAAYVGVQLVASAVARLVKPTKRRPELRSGQRYPAFARPTTEVAPSVPSAPERPDAQPSTESATDDSATGDASAEPSSDGESSDVGSAEPETASEEPEPDLSNTRVFTAADDAPSVSPSAVRDGECPDCGASVDAASVDGSCPDCGAKL